MSEIKTSEIVNIQLVESLVQAIRSLSPAEQALLEEKLFGEIPYPSNFPDEGMNITFLFSTKMLTFQ